MKVIIEGAVEILGGDKDNLLRSKRGATNSNRDIVMYVARRRFGHKLQDIADAFGCVSYSVVGSATHKIEKQMFIEPALLGKAKKVELGLSQVRHLKT